MSWRHAGETSSGLACLGPTVAPGRGAHGNSSTAEEWEEVPPTAPHPHSHHHAHTHTCTITYAYLATLRQEELCVSAPDKVALLPESSLRGCERCYSSLKRPTKVRHIWIKVLQAGRWWEMSKRSEKSSFRTTWALPWEMLQIPWQVWCQHNDHNSKQKTI